MVRMHADDDWLSLSSPLLSLPLTCGGGGGGAV